MKNKINHLGIFLFSFLLLTMIIGSKDPTMIKPLLFGLMVVTLLMSPLIYIALFRRENI